MKENGGLKYKRIESGERKREWRRVEEEEWRRVEEEEWRRMETAQYSRVGGSR